MLRAVEEREPFFGFEQQRGDAGGGERIGRGHRLAAIFGEAFADHAEREVGERREVTTGTDRAARRDHGMHAGVQQLAQPLATQRAGAAATGREHGGAQQHHAADGFAREWGADPGRVRADEVFLELLDLRRADPDLGQGAEPGVHAVDRRRRIATRDDFVDHGARRLHE